MDEPSNPELESFRQQWRAEVSAKSKPGESSASRKSTQPPSKPKARRPSVVPKAPPRPTADAGSDNEPSDEDADLESPAPLYPPSFEVSSARSAVEKDVEKFSGTAPKEPESALEHYEKAAEREAQGNLGDSLTHYRKAFRVCTPSYTYSRVSNTSPR
jgi:F-box protein 9